MNRIFPTLALFSVVFMTATLVVGLSLGDVSDPDARQTQEWASVHRMSGVASALVIVLVNSIVVTYFIGTSRWCREVVETYSLDERLVRTANMLKRRAFPYAVVSMLAVVGVVALGGAADPGATRQLEPVAGIGWSTFHLVGALVGLAVVGYGFIMQWSFINYQRDVIAQIMWEVRRIRIERGLEVDEQTAPPMASAESDSS